MHLMIDPMQCVPAIWWDEKNVVDGENAKLVGRIQKRYGYEYQTTPGVMDGKTMLSFSTEHRKKSGLNGGDPIHLELAVATTPREVKMPDAFLKALKDSNTLDFFNSLSNSLQRYHCDLINGAKTEETRQRRIDKAISLFKEGKKR
jgi:hypothetical protein